MKIVHLPPIAIVTGLLLIGLSLLWPSLLGKSVWSDQQAHERSRASADLHGLVHEHHDEETSGEWLSTTVDTPENTLSIHCAPNGRVWISASFGTLYWGDVALAGWTNRDLRRMNLAHRPCRYARTGALFTRLSART